MNREAMIEEMSLMQQAYDLLIIGGGASGVGIALESAARGYKTLLLEQADFTKSTSGKSTKLVHGGVRYLAQGHLHLVREACVERGRLLKNAPHIVKNQEFIIPAYSKYDELLYTLGLKFYDLISGTYSLGRSSRISSRKVLNRIPGLKSNSIKAGISYHDGQFDDSRLAISVLQTAIRLGAHAVNYMRVSRLTKNPHGMVDGVEAEDVESGKTYHVKASALVNATGVFADDILQMDQPGTKKMLRPSQGIHIVLDKSFLPGSAALMIPKTDDGRVLFAVPWNNKVILGTTDTPIEKPSLEPVALDEEIDFILNTAARYLSKTPDRKDVLSIFSGLRPLAASNDDGAKTKEISRSHKILVSKSGLFTMIGGKWTTFRKMAEDMLNKVEKTKGWKRSKPLTRQLRIHGYIEKVNYDDPLHYYGSDKENLESISVKQPEYSGMLSKKLPVYKSQVVWAVREEMAQTLEDVLSRRTRCLLLDAREAVRIAPEVAEIMAKEMGKDENWIKRQLSDFNKLASVYYL